MKYEAVTTVPNTPSWIRGVTNLRGAVVPVVDLAVKSGLMDSRISKFFCIITDVLFQGEKLTMGVLSDSVSQVIELSADDIEGTPPFGTRVKTEYLLGMGPLGKKFCLILDIDKVLSADEFLATTESANQAESRRARLSSRIGCDPTGSGGRSAGDPLDNADRFAHHSSHR